MRTATLAILTVTMLALALGGCGGGGGPSSETTSPDALGSLTLRVFRGDGTVRVLQGDRVLLQSSSEGSVLQVDLFPQPVQSDASPSFSTRVVLDSGATQARIEGIPPGTYFLVLALLQSGRPVSGAQVPDVVIAPGRVASITATLTPTGSPSPSPSPSGSPSPGGPVLDSASRTSGFEGARVEIAGSGFMSAGPGRTVDFNGVPGDVLAWSDTAISVSVPAGATTGPLSVMVDGRASNAIPFSVQNWGLTTSLAVERMLSCSAAPGNGFLYSFNGFVNSSAISSGTADGRAFFATQNPDGTVGAWTETTEVSVPAGFKRAAANAASFNGFIYQGGGANNGPSWNGQVWFTKPTAAGPISSWQVAANNCPVSGGVGSAPFIAAENGFLYLGGGFRAFGGGNSAELFFAPLNPSTGDVGAWTATTPLPTGSTQGELIPLGTTMYLILGNGTDQAFKAPINPDGSLGAWVPQASLPGGVSHVNAAVLDGTVFVMASQGNFCSDLQPDGSLGTWRNWDPIPEAVSPLAMGVLSNQFYYLIGNGTDVNGPTALRQVYMLDMRP